MLKKFVLFIGLVFIIIGGVLFAITIKAKIKERDKDLITKDYTYTEDINNIELDLFISDVEIKKAEDGKTTVVCYETEELYHEVSYKDNKLVVEEKDNRSFFNKFVTFFTPRMRVVISLPEDAYDNLKIVLATGDVNVAKGIQYTDAYIKTSTGDIYFCALVTNTLEVSVSTGDVKISDTNMKNIKISGGTSGVDIEKVNVSEDINVNISTGKTKLTDSTSKNIDIKASTGDVYFKNFVASNGIKVKTSTGDVKFDKSDADHLDIETSTGDVTGTLLSAKSFFTETSTGKSNVPKTTGGECNIKTSTGNINITISE